MANTQVLVLILGYVIGFTAGFIAFSPSTKYPTNTPVQQVVAQQQEHQQQHVEQEQTPQVAIIFDEQGLFVEKDEVARIVSGRLRDGIDAGPGFHVDIPYYASSPDGEYIYYCEQQSASEEICHGYLYLVNEHVVKPLKVDGLSLTSSVIEADFTWQSDDVVASSRYISKSDGKPWELVVR